MSSDRTSSGGQRQRNEVFEKLERAMNIIRNDELEALEDDQFIVQIWYPPEACGGASRHLRNVVVGCSATHGSNDGSDESSAFCA